MATTNTNTAKRTPGRRRAPAASTTTRAPGRRRAPAATVAAPAKLPRCVKGRVGKAKPQAKMLRVIAEIGKHPGTALRKKRWPNYKVGMTLHHCQITEGLAHLDVLFWTQYTGTDGKPLMVLREPTQAELDANDAEWAKQQGEEGAKAA
jgi:hypothetical protein